MAAIYSGSASAAATSVAIPTHAVGDIIVVWAYIDGSTTVPTKPTAGGTVPTWTDIDAPAGANLNACRSAYAIATATNHTTGTWTTATGICVAVIQNPNATPIGGHSIRQTTNAGAVLNNGITQTDTTGASVLLYFYAARQVTAWTLPPATGWTNVTSVATEVCLNTKDDTTTDGAQSQACTMGANTAGIGHVIEIVGGPPPAGVPDLVTARRLY